MKNLPHANGTPTFGWMPDSRHIVTGVGTAPGVPSHLFIADTESEKLVQITTGTGNEQYPWASPDGKAILFNQGHRDFDIVQVALDTGAVQPLIVTGQSESMPAWAAKSDSLVYLSDRLGTMDIWLHANGTERPLMTRESFGEHAPRWMYAPVLSPDGQRVIVVANAGGGKNALWMASVEGGAPVRLVDAADPDVEWAGDWSPDGSKFAYMSEAPDGKFALKVVSTSGGETPQVVQKGIYLWTVPSWSPDGEWIAYSDESKKVRLVSPDGQRHKDLGGLEAGNLGFAKDGKTAYGVHTVNGKLMLFSVDVAAEPAKVKDLKELDSTLEPTAQLNPSMRFTVSPDGKSIAFSTAKAENSVWMLTGFEWR
jgi:Tol biopolymer transport system component